MNKVKKILTAITNIRFRYLLYGSKVTVEKGAILNIDTNVSLKKCKIYVKKGDTLSIGNNTTIINTSINMISGGKSEIHIGENCKIIDYGLSLTWGLIRIGDYNIIEKGSNSLYPYLEICGQLTIGDYNHLLCNAWVRYGGIVKIGNRNAINEGTEIRSDDSVTIGDYNQISYNCAIWDTNTHNIYKAEKRRELTDAQYPDFGLEYEKPKTSPVNIGNDCWIGKNVSILKGVELNDKCIVAFGTVLTSVKIPRNKTIFNKTELKTVNNQL